MAADVLVLALQIDIAAAIGWIESGNDQARKSNGPWHDAWQTEQVYTRWGLEQAKLASCRCSQSAKGFPDDRRGSRGPPHLQARLSSQ